MDSKFCNPRVVSEPSAPRCRKPIKEISTENYYLNNKSYKSHTESKMSRQRLKSRDETSDNIDIDKTESSSEEDDKAQTHSQNRSKTFSPERSREKNTVENKKTQHKENSLKRDTNNFSRLPYSIPIIIVILAFSLFYLHPISKSEEQKKSINNLHLLLFESIENIKAKFYNQESDIWNDIASAINEVMSRNPKKPSIILLFANETAIMNCLATDLANASSTVLQTDSPLYLTPEDFGDDAGEIINTLNGYSPPKKIVVIHDILRINVEAIKALHNLCDRINPLIEDAIYILTMRTTTYQLSQKKLAFVEEQIYRKLSKNIDQDILMALITRITDGAIILVQPEPHLKYC